MTDTSAANVSVIVCVRNRAGMIKECLQAIRAAQPAELIVVDGMSTDGTRAIAERLADVVITDQSLGLSAGRQFGAEAASNGLIAYVDSDVLVEPDTLRNLATRLDTDPTVGAVHASVRSTPESYWSACTQLRMDLLDEYSPGEKTTLGCMCVVLRRQAVLDNPFDPYFIGASEDEDFYFRLRRAGWRLIVGEGVAYHRHRATVTEGIRQRIWYGRGSMRLALKGYPGAKVGLIVHPVKLLGVVLAARAVRAKRFEILPYIVIQSTAHYAGELIEAGSLLWKLLRRRPLPKPRESLRTKQA